VLPLAIAGAGLGVASAFGSFFGGRDRAAEMRAQTREQVRRDQLGHNVTVGTARVRGAGSGIDFESTSLQDYLTAMQDEFKRQEDWTLRTGMKQASAMQASAAWGLIGDLGGTMTQFGAANNWWQSAPSAAGAAGAGASSGVPYYLARP
jgi:hypothetical protein